MRSRPNLVLGVIAAVVLVVTVVVAVVTLQRDPTVPDASTPEGTAQAFVMAYVTDDDATAISLLEPDPDCPTPQTLDVGRPDRAFLTVVEVTGDDERAEVVLDVTVKDGAFESWTHGETYEVIHGEDGWRIRNPLWPAYGCR